ncbi:MAG: hypothetical protein H8E30_01680 [Alphaproteobacteria bacterium]|nr:hypothetical protein [Alphaproteobacteria bacterium]
MCKHDGKFQQGQSGNPKGRPRGSRNKPKEISAEQEATNLIARGMQHLAAGDTDAARTAIKKGLALFGPYSSDGLEKEANGIIEVAQIEMAKSQCLDLVRGLYDDADANYLKHVGLPKDASWGRFQSHYAVGEDDVDADRATNDLVTYPHVAKRIAELQAAA